MLASCCTGSLARARAKGTVCGALMMTSFFTYCAPPAASGTNVPARMETTATWFGQLIWSFQIRPGQPLTNHGQGDDAKDRRSASSARARTSCGSPTVLDSRGLARLNALAGLCRYRQTEPESAITQFAMHSLNHDHHLRAVLRAHLAPRVGERNLLVDELLLAWGAVRADVTLVNGTLEGFEIKAAKDTLKRLPAQIEAYDAIFEYAWLVTKYQTPE